MFDLFLCPVELDDLICYAYGRLRRGRTRFERALLNIELRGGLRGVSDMWGVFFVLLPFAVILVWHNLDRALDRQR